MLLGWLTLAAMLKITMMVSKQAPQYFAVPKYHFINIMINWYSLSFTSFVTIRGFSVDTYQFHSRKRGSISPFTTPCHISSHGMGGTSFRNHFVANFDDSKQAITQSITIRKSLNVYELTLVLVSS